MAINKNPTSVCGSFCAHVNKLKNRKCNFGFLEKRKRNRKKFFLLKRNFSDEKEVKQNKNNNNNRRETPT